MKPGYKKGQIVVVYKGMQGNHAGTITKIVSNSLKAGNKLDIITVFNPMLCKDEQVQDKVKYNGTVLCEDKSDKSERKYCNKPVFEEYYIRPATTHEKIAYSKGIFNPRRKTFDELEPGDTIMLKATVTDTLQMVEVRVVAVHRVKRQKKLDDHNTDKWRVQDICVIPVKLIEEKGTYNMEEDVLKVNNLEFIPEKYFWESSYPPVLK